MQSSLRGNILYLMLPTLVKQFIGAHSKISSFLRDEVMIQPIRLLTPSLLLMTDLFSSVSLSSAAHK